MEENRGMPHHTLSDLRRQAESMMKKDAETLPNLSPEEVRKLVHEFRTYQIELEMQNEDLRQAQIELETARDRYLDLYDFAPVGYLTIGPKGVIEEANLIAAEMLGVVRHELIHQRVSLFVDAESQNAFYLHRRAVLETSEKQTCELGMVCADGRQFDAELTCVSVKDEEGHPTRIRIAMTDITERKRMAKEMIRLERLSALGELSAGVSHNLNNILTSVLLPAQLLLRTVDDPEVREPVEEIFRAGKYARDLVHQLHVSSREADPAALCPVSVNRAIQGAIAGTRARWKDESELKNIAIEVVTDLGDVPQVCATEAEMHTILVNLLLNAVDAMPSGGQIVFRTQAGAKGVEISVRDTGVGMDEETSRRVFEPFFTTKKDVGSGLGLSTAYSMVTRWGGDMRVQSAPGQGTTFTFRLPIWKNELKNEPSHATEPSRQGKLLIVDDDNGVCNLLARLLGAHHNVDTALDGQTALKMFGPGEYDVVMMDMSMPGMSGDRVLQDMRQQDIALVTVLITGWEIEKSDARLPWFDFQIQKPFDDIEAIENVIAQAISLHDKRVL